MLNEICKKPVRACRVKHGRIKKCSCRHLIKHFKGDKLSTAFAEQRNFVWAAAGRKELLSNELQTMLTPIVRAIEDITAFKDSKRNTTFFNHVSAISEGVQAVGWLTIVSFSNLFILFFETSFDVTTSHNASVPVHQLNDYVFWNCVR